MEYTELELRSDPAEASLIGALGFHAESMAHLLQAVSPDSFHKPARGSIWSAAKSLSSAGKPIDPVAIARQLHVDGKYNNAIEHLLATEMATPHSVDLASRYAETVTDLARKRELLRVCQRATEIVFTAESSSEAFTLAQAEFEKVAKRDEEEPSTLNWLQLVDEFEVTHAVGGSSPGIPSPWWQLDYLTGGFFGSRVYVIGGRPGTGKVPRPSWPLSMPLKNRTSKC